MTGVETYLGHDITYFENAKWGLPFYKVSCSKTGLFTSVASARQYILEFGDMKEEWYRGFKIFKGADHVTIELNDTKNEHKNPFEGKKYHCVQDAKDYIDRFLGRFGIKKTGDKKMAKRLVRNFMMLASVWTLFCLGRLIHPMVVFLSTQVEWQNCTEGQSVVLTWLFLALALVLSVLFLSVVRFLWRKLYSWIWN